MISKKSIRSTTTKLLPLLSGLLLYLVVGTHGYSASFSPQSNYTACFTPGEACTDKLIKYIKSTQHTIFIQSYSFTSKPIYDALLLAHKRGIQIKIISDSGQLKKRRGKRHNNSMIPRLIKAGIPIWVDQTVRIAHNKVMIFDQAIIETGSFNFTYSANHFNSENMLIIHDRSLANAYLKNWYSEQRISQRQLVKKKT